jgi:hypothetical protein
MVLNQRVLWESQPVDKLPARGGQALARVAHWSISLAQKVRR